jgi:hypothetical protein
LPLLYLMRPEIFQNLKFARALSGGVVFGILLSLSKITAVMSFMQYFPRELSDNYGLTLLQGLKGLATQLTGFMTIAPVFMAQGKDLNGITQLFQSYTGSRYEIWETDISIPLAALLILLFYVVAILRRGITKAAKINTGTIIAAIFLALGSWLAIEFTLAQGTLYQLLDKLPIIRSTHVNVRFASAFIVPASILASRGFDSLFLKQKFQATIPFTILSLVTIAAFLPYFLLNPHTHLKYFDLKLPLQNYEQIQAGQRFPVRSIADVKDAEVFKLHSSNLYQLYDAIFGYEREYFHPKVQTGSVFKEEDGYYNMTNPASYVFPRENNLQAFVRFRVDQKADLKLFINRKQPDFKISTLQTVSNIINVIAVVLLLTYIFFEAIKRSMAYRRS